MGAEDEDAAQEALVGQQTVGAGATSAVSVDEAEVAASQEQAPPLPDDPARPSRPPRRPSLPGAYSVVPATNAVSRRSSFNGSSSGRRDDSDGGDDDEVDSWDEARGLAPPVLGQQEDVWAVRSLRRDAGRSFDNDDSDEEEGRSRFGGNGEAGHDASVEHSAVVSTVYLVDDDVTHGTVVVEDEHDDNATAREEANAANAERTDEVDGRAMSKRQRYRRRLIVAAVVALVAVGAVLGVLGGTGHIGGGDSAREDPSSESDGPSRYEAMRFIIVSGSVSDAALLDDPTTPQSKALRWLSDEDGARLSPTVGSADGIVQRYVMAVIYFSADGPNWYDSCEFLTEKHECDWYYLTNPEDPDSYKGLHCEDSTLDSSVTHVHMYWNNLTGKLPAELGSLETLVNINFGINNLEGTIPSKWGTLPRLQMLLLNDNFLTGQIPTELGQLRYLRSFSIYVNPDLKGNMDFMCPLVEDTGILRFTPVNCGGSTPEIECSCCSHCCSQETRMCCSTEDGSCWDSTPNECAFGC